MHGGTSKVLVLWFILTPILVALFIRMGWGFDSILAAMAISAVLIWLCMFILKKIRNLFPGWGALLRWGATGEMTYSQGDEMGDETNGWQVEGGQALDEDELDQEEGFLPTTTALLGNSRGMEDLHPALRGTTLPRRPKGPPQYAFVFGSHTMDIDIVYGTGLIVAPELAGSGITWTLAKELARLRVTSLVIDFTGQFDKLPLENPTGYLLSSPNSPVPPKLQQRVIPMAAQKAGEIGRGVVHQGGQYVLRFHSYPNKVEATVALLSLLQGMYRWEKERAGLGYEPTRCVVLVNQAHQFLPYDTAYSVANAEPTLAKNLQSHLKHYLEKGGESGMHFYLVTDKPTRMDARGLEQDVWFVQQPQSEELRYLAESTGFPREAFTKTFPHQVFFMDILNKISMVLTLPESPHDITEDLVIPVHMSTMTDVYPVNEVASYTQPMALPPVMSVQSTATPERQQLSYTSEQRRPTQVTSTARTTQQPENAGVDFSDDWLSWVCFLYSIGRLKPSTVQSPPNDLFAVAQGLGLPVEKDDMVNRNRAARMMGYVQALSADKRSRYAARAYQFAPELQRVRGGGLKDGHDPPTSFWRLPSSSQVLLPLSKGKQQRVSEGQIESIRAIIERTLKEQRVKADVLREDIRIGPRILQIGIRPKRYPELVMDRSKGGLVEKRDTGGEILYKKTKVEDILKLEEDIALALNELGLGEKGKGIKLRMINVIPGTGCVGLEIPNPVPSDVPFREVVDSPEFQEAAARTPLTMAMGKDIAGKMCVPSLRGEPHRLVTGFTGSGKSVGVNASICSALMQHTPEEVRMVMIDPKQVELKEFEGIPHLLAPIAITVEEAMPLLFRLGMEMDRRYKIMAAVGVRNWEDYEKLRKERPDRKLQNLPLIMVVIDELADMMMRPGMSKKERTMTEGLICRLLQLGRAAGIHMQLGTQRPSVDVITGLMKANAPARVAFMASSAGNSRITLDEGGAERLLGRGDLLYLAPGIVEGLQRMQHTYLADKETVNIATHWRKEKARVDAAGTSDYATYTLPAMEGNEDVLTDAEEEAPQEEHDENLDDEEGQPGELLGEDDPLFPLVVEELSRLLARGQEVISTDKMRHGRLSPNIPTMKHPHAVAIRDALEKAGYIGAYSNKFKGHPILGEKIAKEGTEEKASSAT